MVALLALAAVAGCDGGPSAAPAERSVAPASNVPGIQLPPPGAGWDLQLGGDASLPADVTVIERDWFEGRPEADAYTICYINAFQTQPNESDTDRPDLTRNWPPDLVLLDLEDPDWEGEFLVDIGTPERRAAAAAHVGIMIEACAERGAQAVELDNLDFWTREVVGGEVPFEQEDAVEYARLSSTEPMRWGSPRRRRMLPSCSDPKIRPPWASTSPWWRSARISRRSSTIGCSQWSAPTRAWRKRAPPSRSRQVPSGATPSL